MKILSRIFFTLFFSLLAGGIIFVVYSFYSKRKAYTAMAFSAALTQVKEKHGSSTDYFVHLSDGKSFLFTIPHKSIYIGDTLVKVEDEPFFTLVTLEGRVRYKIGMNGKLMPPDN